MCTVSFVPARGGFSLAMNRDESLQRVATLAPQIFRGRHHSTLYPSEPGGGTWIGINDAGICLALINWYRIAGSAAGEATSRGLVIPHVLQAATYDEIPTFLESLSLGRMKPFRLIAIARREKRLTEFCWDMNQLRARKLPWLRQHWFSSGLDEPRAERERGLVCTLAQNEASTGGIGWLRRLHRSHAPARGPFSICMHRSDAATLSYSEIVVRGNKATIRYMAGPPCGHFRIVKSALCLEDA